MPTTQAKADRASDADALEQIRELREQVESLLRERVTPILSDAADRAEDAARGAASYVRGEAEVVADKVREKPLTWILVAAVAGYLLGRVTR
jgi:ElaB/YqjD/DUF883 family membrane-anchored ribosome-binding protein